MSDPVVLIGTDGAGSIGAIGLYETAEKASFAVQSGEVPDGLYYAIMTPAMNSCIRPREIKPKQ